MDALAYKPGLSDVIARLKLLHDRGAEDRIFAEFEVPCAALAEFARQYGHGYCDWPDAAQRVRFWDALLAERAAVEDDSIPSAYLSEMDQGLYGGILGGTVQFMSHPENGWISSMVAPLLREWSELDRVVARRGEDGNPWWQRYRRQLETFVDGAAGRFAVSHFILIDGLNFCFELVGATRTYLSLDECPDTVRRAIDVAFELNVAVQEAFFKAVPPLCGGTASNMVGWAPGRVVSESVDPFHMTSVDYFERWGREPVQRIFDRFDGGVLHLHGNGRHLLEAATTLRGLRAIFMGDDRGYAKAFEIAADLKARAGAVPLVMQTELGPFLARLADHSLPGGVFYKVRGASNAAEANWAMERVREYRT